MSVAVITVTGDGRPAQDVTELTVLTTNNARMDVAGLAFDPMCGRYLAVAGLQAVQVRSLNLIHCMCVYYFFLAVSHFLSLKPSVTHNAR